MVEIESEAEPAFAASLEQVAAALSPLRASNSLEGLGRAVARLVAGSVAAACRIDVFEEETSLEPAALRPLARSARPGRVDLANPSDDPGEALAGRGDAAVVDDPARALAWIVVPLVARGRAIGSLRVAVGQGEATAPTLALVHHVAASLALGLSAAELHEHAERVSRRLQESLLPPELPVADWFELAARYAPASANMHVGGDWYDAQLVSADELAISVGDVAGHGVEAAARMGEVRSAMAAFRLMSQAPDHLIAMVHRLCAPKGIFATALCARLTPRGELRWASAGHLPPVLARPGDAALLSGHPSPPLGLSAEVDITLDHGGVRPGDTVVVYTDGLVERRDEAIDDSLARLVRDVRGWSALEAGEIADRLLEQRQAAGPTADDIALVVVRFTGEG